MYCTVTLDKKLGLLPFAWIILRPIPMPPTVKFGRKSFGGGGGGGKDFPSNPLFSYGLYVV